MPMKQKLRQKGNTEKCCRDKQAPVTTSNTIQLKLRKDHEKLICIYHYFIVPFHRMAMLNQITSH